MLYVITELEVQINGFSLICHVVASSISKSDGELLSHYMSNQNDGGYFPSIPVLGVFKESLEILIKIIT